MRKTFFKSVVFFFFSALVCCALESCAEGASKLDFIEKKITAHRDSSQQVLFIPSKTNLKSEMSFLYEMLYDFEKETFSKREITRADSIEREIKVAIEKTKGWTSKLENYDLQKIIEQQISKEVFLEKRMWEQIPFFYKNGSLVLQKKELSDLKKHIEKQKDVYLFLKKEFELSEGTPALLAVKDFIGFLNSVKKNRS